MIESHFDPENALTDAAQQISPATLEQLLAQLVVREEPAASTFSISWRSYAPKLISWMAN